MQHKINTNLKYFLPKSGSPPYINQHYQKLLASIRDKIKDGGYSTTQQREKRSILRIAIQSLGSPLWGENCGASSDEGGASGFSLTMFLIALRGLLRSAFATALITIPTHLFQDKAFIQRVERLCDTVVRLESFAGSEKEKNPVFKDYHGLIHVVQIPRLNSLIPAQQEMPDLAFKLRRKKFTIEKLHLPPELSQSFSESSGIGDGSKSFGCSTSSTSKLAF
ncbi:elongator complex protein 4-like [Plakobranchus ocellatus]|uniref:Elongator complex protein 4 n=1 Tax=Plakobranchus ocellatus TaxID=259542 RepID=A0AAV4AJZ7_9GAST|nr:elongator complex protein 4-like [Plakobranchus ocellatus]